MLKREYQLLEAGTTQDLGIKVTQHLDAGWETWGNPFGLEAEFDADIRDVHYYQAVVRYTETKTAVSSIGYTVGVPETPEQAAGDRKSTRLNSSHN